MKNSYLKKILPLFLLFSFSNQVTAQNWTNYYPSDGLIEGGIYAIVEDQNNDLWFGSWTNPEGTPGLGMFNGTDWLQFTTDDGLVGDNIRALFHDSANNLWIGTTTGITKYDYSSVTNYTTTEGLGDNFILSIIEDNSGNLWFGTNVGVSKFDGTTWTNYNTSDNPALLQIGSIIQDHNGDFWFGSYFGGIIKFDGTTWTNYTAENSGLAANDIFAMYQDSDNNYWFGTYNGAGVSKFDGTTWTTYTTTDGLSNNRVRVITQDNFGDLWFGTNAGLSNFNGTTWTTYTSADGLIPGGVRSIYQDNNDDLWVGTWSSGVSKFEISKVNIPDPNFEQSLIDIGVDSDGIINQQILRTDALAVTDLQLTNSQYPYGNPLIPPTTGKIADLTGIEAFVNLTKLGLGYSDITSVDLTFNIELDELFLADNLLTAIDISKNTKLTRFGVMRNPNIGVVDVSKNTLLEELFLENTGINTINLSTNLALWKLRVQDNILTGVDVSLNTNLIDFSVRYNPELTFVNIRNGNNDNIVGFDVRDTPNLTCITADGIAVPEVSQLMFDYSGGLLSTDCGTVYIPDANFEQALIVTGIDQLGIQDHIILRSEAIGAIYLTITDAGATDLTGIEAFINLESIEGDGNNLTSVNVSNNTLLKQFHLNQNSLTSIDLSNNLLLEGVGLNSNNLSEIDLSLQTNLTLVAFGDNPELKRMNLRNGNNANLTQFIQWDLPSLNCITADDIISQEMIDSGLSFSADCTYVAIPDPNFEQALIDLEIDSDGIVNSFILRSDAEALAGELNVNDRSISDLTGIEAFVNINRLKAWNNSIAIVDVTENVLLERLELVGNQITSIDVTQNTELNVLYLENNLLNTVDVSQNTKLGNLAVGLNPLISLDVTTNVNLWALTTEVTQISEIDLSNNIILEQIWIADNPNLTQLDVSNNPLLFNLGIYNTSITTLDLSNNSITRLYANYNPNLTHLDMRNGNNLNITTFNIGNTPNLTCINADGIDVPDISQVMVDSGKAFSPDCNDVVLIPDANFEQALIDSGVDKNGFSGDILRSDAEIATYLDITDDGVLDLTGIEAFINLESIEGDGNNLDAVDISNNTLLKQLHFNGNSLTSIDLSNNLLLEGVGLNSNNLSEIDLSSQSNLTLIAFGDNVNLTSMNLRNGNNVNLTQFYQWDLPNLSCITSDDIISQEMIDSGLPISPDCTDLVLIPDANFEQALIDSGVDKNGFSGDILRSDAEAKTGQLDISDKNISDLTGIEAFVNLTRLKAWNNSLTGVDVTQNILLERLELVNNQITDIDVSQNTELTVFWLETNALTEVDISANTKLRNVAVGYNNLTELDVSNSPDLWAITAEDNNITEIDISNNLDLVHFWVFSNPNFNKVDVSKQPLLESMGIWNTSIEALNLSNNPNFIRLYAADNPLLEHLDIRNGNNSNIAIFDLNNTSNLTCINADAIISTEMTASGKTFSEDCGDFVYIEDENFEQSLIDIGIDSDGVVNTSILREDAEAVTSLNLTNPLFDSSGFENPLIVNVAGKIADLTGLDAFLNLTNFQLTNSDIASIDVTNLVLLEELFVTRNSLTAINITQNTQLKRFGVMYSTIAGTVDVSQNTLLEELFLHETGITSIDLTTNTNLWKLFIYNNNLSQLNLSTNTSLTEVRCQNNQLTQLDITSNVLLARMDAQYNPGLSLITDPAGYPSMTSMNLSGIGLSNYNLYALLFPNLQWLLLNDNSLDKFNGNNALFVENLFLNNNIIDKLILSPNTALKQLQANNNVLTQLDVRNGNNMALHTLNVTGNLLTCISVDDPADVTMPYASWNMDSGVILSDNCGAEPEVILIPDGNFEDKLIADLIDTNGKNGNILMTEAEAVTSLDVSGQGIEYLTGIEGFVNLTDLNVSDNLLDDINLLENTDLVNLDVSHNNLSELFVNSGRDLVSLNCSNNQLGTLNLSDLTDVEVFDGSLNLFQNIDATNNDLLAYFNISSNMLSGLDMRNGNNPDIILFDATNNPTLFCIGVDDQSNIPTGWSKDVWSDYSNNPDCIPPTIVSQGVTIDLDNRGDASVIARDFDNGSTDNVSANVDLSFIVDIEDFTCSNLGSNFIELTVTDEAGNSSSEIVEVIVQDIEPPTVSTDQSFSHDLNGDAIFILDPLDVHKSSSDNCGVPLLSVNPSIFTSPGTYSVTLTATDASGNSTEDYIDIEIEDSQNSLELRFGGTSGIVYPIPFIDELNISFSKSINLNSVSVQLISIGGTVYDISVSPNSGSGDFVSGNTSSIPTGIYVLQVTVGNKIDSATIVKD